MNYKNISVAGGGVLGVAHCVSGAVLTGVHE